MEIFTLSLTGDSINWELIVYILSGSTAFIILLLTTCLLKQFMKGRVWKLRRQRTRDLQTPPERFVLNDIEELDDNV